MDSNKEIIVVSGINFFEGGPLTIMQDVLQKLSRNFSDTYRIIALVNNKSLYLTENIEFVEFPKSRTSWFFRLYYEFIYFKSFSKKLKPKFWLSMHDITPNVVCKDQFVYCHNPAPFFKPKKEDIKYGLSTYAFSKLYKYLYGINIKKNKNVIVQQDWLREEFTKRWNLQNVIVAYPEIKLNKTEINPPLKKGENKIKTLFYPSFPRSFKNFELICNAFELLDEKNQQKIKIYLTINDGLNKYAKDIVNKFKKHPNICFIGILKRDEVFKYYANVDALIFPSRLETWGLPITEFKNYNKPILAANLPYAKETVNSYDKAIFFDTNSPKELAELYKKFIEEKLDFAKTNEIIPSKPFVKGWQELLEYLFNKNAA